MGREVRKVPKDWKHPQAPTLRLSGYEMDFIPLHGRSFAADAAEWDQECAKWNAGIYPDYARDEHKSLPYEKWDGERPEQNDYMPDWPASERTHFMMYETCTEGTPISPAFETPEELARWLADNGASSFGSSTATYEQWLPIARGGWAPGLVYSPQTGLISGVEASTQQADKIERGEA